jgi:hypothetical protein
MNGITIVFIVFVASIVTIYCLCIVECCCELCMNDNHTLDEDVLTNELNEISKVSSPIQDTQSTHIEV